MSIEVTLGNYFKPEIKNSGTQLYEQGKLSIASATDTEVLVYVRVLPPLKVRLSTDGLDHPSLTASCNCPIARKSRLCKHIWGALLTIGQAHSDFLSSKTSVHVAESVSNDEASYHFRENAKKRASIYRKEQYQKQKLRAKASKHKNSETLSLNKQNHYTAQVEAALAYFQKNGFPMPAGPDKETLGVAKRRLSRVFHPDRGGSHDEAVELNKYYDILIVLTE